MSDGEPAQVTQWSEALRWLAFAAKDLRVARMIAPDHSLLDVTAFHIQQAIEKTLKSLLVAAAADVRRVHDINELATLAHRHWPDLVPEEFSLAHVTSWYIVSRYPGIDDISLNAEEIVAALDQVEALIASVMQLVPAGLQAS
jgi:HEPN domain-containing protein